MIINPNGDKQIKVATNWLGRELSFEVGKVGFRAPGTVLVRYGETVVLGSCVSGEVNPNLDYFPLSISYEEKFYAAGKISGSRFIKREGRPSDEAILNGRLIDRPIRPLFPKGYRNECQVVATGLSTAPKFRPDVGAMIAASAAVSRPGAPFEGPVAGVRVGYDEKGDFTAFLSRENYQTGKLDLVVAGNPNGVMMVEAGMDEVDEEVVADAIEWADEAIQPVLKLQQELVKKVGVEVKEYELVEPNEAIQQEADKWLENKLGENLRKAYPERNSELDRLRQEFAAEVEAKLGEEYEALKNEYHDAFTMAVHQDVREGIIKGGVRPDGRKMDEVRNLSSEVAVLPRVHGSSLFTRGVTQAMNVITLAPLS
jgi:polyribonucleotide nucleotidyltransferase